MEPEIGIKIKPQEIIEAVRKMKKKERAFERVLGLVGRRGYDFVSVSAEASEDRSSLMVLLTLESERPGDVLVNHLAKLVEVEQVEMAPTAGRLLQYSGGSQ